MQFRIKHLFIILLILIIFTGIIQADDILSIDQIKPGMTGIGKTVFQGCQVESFPIKVIDVLKNTGLNKDLILIKAMGEKIDKIGGVAAGMSGSPVYIDGKLIGAIGYGWQFTDHHYALVTPIESMLKLLDNSPEKVAETKTLIQFKTPLMVSGLTGRAFKHLQKDLAPYELKLLQGGGLKEIEKSTRELQPGSAIAVQLVRGDINIASIGTLTYLEGDKLLAFGHPFTNKGEVSFLLSEAYINGIIPSDQQPFKLGSPLNLLGSITIDRGSGIAGEINQFPKIIPLRIRVINKERGIEQQVNVQIVKNEDLLTSLVTNIALQAIDASLDRVGKGTARVNLKVMGNGLPDLEVEKDNMYYSRQDIAAVALSDFYQLLNIITTNPFKEVNLIDLQLDVEIAKEDNVALVQEAKVLNKDIKPGDTLELEIKLLPYRQEPVVKHVFLELPVDIQPGMASVVIDGGFTGQSYQVTSDEEQQNNDNGLNQAQNDGYKDLDTMINDFLEQPHNNDLIVKVNPDYPIAQREEGQDEETRNENSENEKSESEKSESENPGQNSIAKNSEQPEIKKIIKTEYVLEGSLSLDINIQSPDISSTDINNIK